MADGELLNVRAPSKSQRAYQWLRARISRQEYTPGYRLVLTTIANDLDMSVVPVREAIRQLEAEGLVTFEPHVGARVAMVDDSDYRNSMQVLGVIEGTATALAAPTLTEQDIAHAREINERMAACLEEFDPQTFTALNHDFHLALFRTCPNARLLDLVRAEWARLGHLRDSTFAFVPGRARDSVKEHDNLLRLIESGATPGKIERAARRHRAATLDAYLEHEHPHAAPTDQAALESPEENS